MLQLMSRGRTGDEVPYKTVLLAGLSGSSPTVVLMPTAGGEQQSGSSADTQPDGLAKGRAANTQHEGSARVSGLAGWHCQAVTTVSPARRQDRYL